MYIITKWIRGMKGVVTELMYWSRKLSSFPFKAQFYIPDMTTITWFQCCPFTVSTLTNYVYIFFSQLDPLKDKTRSKKLPFRQGIFSGLQCCVLEGYPCYINSDCCLKTCKPVSSVALGIFIHFVRILMTFSTQCSVSGISKLYMRHFPYHDAFGVLGTKICNNSTSSEEPTDSTRSKQSLLPENWCSFSKSMATDLQQTRRTEKLNFTRTNSAAANLLCCQIKYNEPHQL